MKENLIPFPKERIKPRKEQKDYAIVFDLVAHKKKRQPITGGDAA